MKKFKGTILVFEMTRKRALELGLLFCGCGHPDSNHFDHGSNPCAYCECKEYHNEVSRKFVDVKEKE